MKRISGIVLLLSLSGIFSFLWGCAAAGPAYQDLAKEYLALAEAYRDIGRLGSASDYYLKAYKMDPSLRVAGFNLVRVYLEDRQYEEAEKLSRQLIQQDPSNLLLRESLGYALYGRGEIEAALKVYEDILERSPGDYRALYNCAQMALEEGKDETLVSLVEELIRLWPEKETLEKELAWAFFRQDRREEAFDVLTRRQKENQLTVEEKYLLGVLYQEQQNYRLSLEMFEEAQKEESLSEKRSADLHFRRASILLLAIEKGGEGLSALETALEKGFSDASRVGILLEGEEENWPEGVSREEVESLLVDKGWVLQPLTPPDREQ